MTVICTGLSGWLSYFERRRTSGWLWSWFINRIYLNCGTLHEFFNHTSLLFCPQPVEDVAAHVEKGYRMESPEGCPDQIYNVMKDCWNEDPSQRPNFTRIEKALESVAATMSSSWWLSGSHLRSFILLWSVERQCELWDSYSFYFTRLSCDCIFCIYNACLWNGMCTKSIFSLLLF